MLVPINISSSADLSATAMTDKSQQGTPALVDSSPVSSNSEPETPPISSFIQAAKVLSHKSLLTIHSQSTSKTSSTCTKHRVPARPSSTAFPRASSSQGC